MSHKLLLTFIMSAIRHIFVSKCAVAIETITPGLGVTENDSANQNAEFIRDYLGSSIKR